MSEAHSADVHPPLLLVDAPFFLYRAFYALPKSIEGKGGMPVNALLGSVNAILSAADEHGARAVVTCFGPDAAPYRVELFDGYHAHRPPLPRELASQWTQAPRLYEALGWQVARQSSSHIILVRPGHRATLSVPDHRQVAKGTLRSLIRQAGLTVDEFVAAIP